MPRESRGLPRLTSSDGDETETLTTEAETVVTELDAETQVRMDRPSDDETIPHQVVRIGRTTT